MTELADVNFELIDLVRSIRPLRQIVRHLIEDKNEFHFVTRLYLENVEDAIGQALDDFAVLQELASTLQRRVESEQDRQMNNTMFFLSIITAIFLPAQFITGLYGMNFVQ